MEQFIKQFDQIQTQMFNFYGESTKETLLLAANYTLENKPFNGMALEKKIEEVREIVKQEGSLFFPMRDRNTERDFVSKLFLHEIDLTQLTRNYRLLIEGGFPEKNYTLQASNYVLDEDHVRRAVDLHKEMKKHHPILTGADDIPISVFITQNKELHIKETAALMNTYYNELKEQFTQGETLQLLSQLLVLWSPTYNENLIPYVVQLKEEFKKRKLPVSRKTYPLLGILTLNTANTQLVEQIYEIYQQLIKLKVLKFNKEIALQLAVQKVVKANIEALNIAGSTHSMNVYDVVYLTTFVTNLTLNLGKAFLDFFIFD